MVFREIAESLGGFFIVNDGSVSSDKALKARQCHVSVVGIAAGFSGTIVLLRIIPAIGPVSREISGFARQNVARFSRITDAGIIGIACPGMPSGMVMAVFFGK